MIRNNQSKAAKKKLLLHCNGRGFKIIINELPYAIAQASHFAAEDETAYLQLVLPANEDFESWTSEQISLVLSPDPNVEGIAVDLSVFAKTLKLAVMWVIKSLLRRSWVVFWATKFPAYDPAIPCAPIQEMIYNTRKALNIAVACLDSMVCFLVTI